MQHDAYGMQLATRSLRHSTGAPTVCSVLAFQVDAELAGRGLDFGLALGALTPSVPLGATHCWTL